MCRALTCVTQLRVFGCLYGEIRGREFNLWGCFVAPVSQFHEKMRKFKKVIPRERIS